MIMASGVMLRQVSVSGTGDFRLSICPRPGVSRWFPMMVDMSSR